MMGLPLGTLTLKAADIDALHQAIRAAGTAAA
jgi:hypothetical protein